MHKKLTFLLLFLIRVKMIVMIFVIWWNNLMKYIFNKTNIFFFDFIKNWTINIFCNSLLFFCYEILESSLDGNSCRPSQLNMLKCNFLLIIMCKYLLDCNNHQGHHKGAPNSEKRDNQSSWKCASRNISVSHCSHRYNC